ncbi:MAG: winged helix-turn-helix domain-containing protein [Anaerolineae bacterium]|nr:winged helix-turn-helix domain-containing protein [Anaerolineae bacterium]
MDEEHRLRYADARYFLTCAGNLQCVALVGISNMGKTSLLRMLCDLAVHEIHLGAAARDFVLGSVDCNRILEMTEQGFYELTLRCLLDNLAGPNGPASETVATQLRAAYARLLHPTSSFDVPLGFNQGMTAIGEGANHRLVLIFDEFDEPLATIDRRVFLNLRALKDQYPQRLSYVTATNRRPGRIRSDKEVGEFVELLAHHTWYLGPLTEADTRQFVMQFARQEGVTFDEADISFIMERAGGHPGLLDAVCRALGKVTGEPERTPSQDALIHRQVAEELARGGPAQAESRKIWLDLTDEEQEALLAPFTPGASPDPDAQHSLHQKHVLLDNGNVEEPRLFSNLFAEFVGRQRIVRRTRPAGVQVDVEAGEASVDGRPIPTLTNLEYKLLLLLYGHLGKICDKYQVVQAVWGEDYIDEVDDARIEKLVSRLRQKIETDPANPKYLLTIRGRGYKLASG